MDGLVEVTPTEMAYLVAQAMAHLAALPPRSGQPIYSDGVCGRYRDYRCDAYLKALTKRLIKLGKVEVSTGEYSSGLVLVQFHDRIIKFMDKWGNEAQKEE